MIRSSHRGLAHASPPTADATTYLDQVILGSRAKSKRVVRTAHLTPQHGRWVAGLDDRELGALPAGRYERLDEVRAAGFPLSCQLRVLRQVDRPLRVEADFPNDR